MSKYLSEHTSIVVTFNQTIESTYPSVTICRPLKYGLSLPYLIYAIWDSGSMPWVEDMDQFPLWGDLGAIANYRFCLRRFSNCQLYTFA